MLRIAITGGMGMGKSTCAAILLNHKVPVIDTDDLARNLVQAGQPALTEICDTFGCKMLNEVGELNRKALAAVVFEDAASRRKLEAILHPRIEQAWMARLAALETEARRAGVVVIPLLYETAVESHFDSIVCVACTTETQRSRLLERGWSEREISRREAAQLPIEQKMARSHQVIWTEGSLVAHAEQVVKVFGLR